MIDQIILKIIENFMKREDFEISNISIDSSLINDLNFDSLSFIQLVVEIEEYFTIEIESINYDEIGNVSDIIKIVKRAKK